MIEVTPEMASIIGEYLKHNLSIEIDRNIEYYSYPYLTVTLKLNGHTISECNTTIYDGERG